MVYEYVENKEYIRISRRESSALLKELESELRFDGIKAQVFLVGSGARNMIMQDENGRIDFDYNLNILSCDSGFDEREIFHVSIAI